MIFGLQGVEFEWDEEKYAANLRKLDVKFEEAGKVFFDPLSIYDDASVEEQREYVLSFSNSASMSFIVFVERGIWAWEHLLLRVLTNTGIRFSIYLILHRHNSGGGQSSYRTGSSVQFLIQSA